MTAVGDTPAARGRTGRRVPWSFTFHRRTQFALDLAVLTLAFFAAYLLRFEFQVPGRVLRDAYVQLPLVLLVQFLSLLLTGVYSFVWRYVGMTELTTFVRSAVYWSVPLMVLRLALPPAFGTLRVPLSVILMDAILAFGGLLGLRVLRRMLYERFERTARARRTGSERPKRTLLLGAGRAGVLAVREIHGRGDMDLDVVGFLDDDPLKRGMVIDGVRVLGGTGDLPDLARELEVDQAVVTIADAPPETIRKVVDVCQRARVRVRTIPGLYEVLQGKVAISRFREVAMEDLLGRAPVRLDEEALDLFLRGRRVMVTGAGGSIGSELARQIARFRPGQLLLVERAEFALFEIHRELGSLWPDLDAVPIVADATDEARMEAVFEQGVPNVLFHAAAHKHVPLMEASPGEALRNNVLGTEVAARLAGENGSDAFVLISTDKAVRPTSVMGASKRLAELVIQDLDASYPGTRFGAVRFGNVLGSAGSVIPIFREQIDRGGPVTVTHPEMTRYFMTIPEAAQLVMQAGCLGDGGEIFVLDMGEPVKIVALAEQMIRLAGHEPGDGVEIVFTGARPGEKLFEELSLDGESMARTRHPKIFTGRFQPYPAERVAAVLEELQQLVGAGDPVRIREFLADVLPEARLDGTAPVARDRVWLPAS